MELNENNIRKSVESAVARASEVAVQAALQAVVESGDRQTRSSLMSMSHAGIDVDAPTSRSSISQINGIGDPSRSEGRGPNIDGLDEHCNYDASNLHAGAERHLGLLEPPLEHACHRASITTASFTDEHPSQHANVDAVFAELPYGLASNHSIHASSKFGPRGLPTTRPFSSLPDCHETDTVIVQLP